VPNGESRLSLPLALHEKARRLETAGLFSQQC
jgi:hypothetical protein